MTSHLSIAIHTLSLLAWAEEHDRGFVTSAHIAGSVGTHAVVIRRVLSQLTVASLVETRRGAGGGAKLGRRAEDITLCEIYEAVSDGANVLFQLTPNGPNPQCPIGAQMGGLMHKLFGDIDEVVRARMSAITLADVYTQVTHDIANARPQHTL